MLEENENIERENRAIEASNAEFEGRLQNGEVEGQDKDCVVGEWGQHISEYEVRMQRMKAEQANIAKREKHFERDT